MKGYVAPVPLKYLLTKWVYLTLKHNMHTCSLKSRLLEPKNQIFIKGLANENEQIVHFQAASYRGGIKGYPNQEKINGYAFVLDDYFVFYDNIITWKIPYKKLIEAKLDNFQMEEERALRALHADAGRQLQETKNTLELIYLDAEGIERNARFQIHGASTIPGEEIKAREFLNYILEFKNKFFHKTHINGTDISLKLEKLMEDKKRSIIRASVIMLSNNNAVIRVYFIIHVLLFVCQFNN